jgi:hypothetical protein
MNVTRALPLEAIKGEAGQPREGREKVKSNQLELTTTK